MSSRVTRSSARGPAGNIRDHSSEQSNSPPFESSSGSIRKRKLPASQPTTSPINRARSSQASDPHYSRRSKRAKTEDAESSKASAFPQTSFAHTTMANNGQNYNDLDKFTKSRSDPSNKQEQPGAGAASNRSQRSRGKPRDPDTSTSDLRPRKTRKSRNTRHTLARESSESQGESISENDNKEDDVVDETMTPNRDRPPPPPPDFGGGDPLNSAFLRRYGGMGGLSSSLRALSGMLSGTSARLRDILEKLKQKDDPSEQLIALTEFSELLLVSTEDNLAGHFSPDAYVKELVALMQPNDFGESNPEVMLLACRCLANLMEALPSATAAIAYGGAVPVLCQKLLEIEFMDLAEQAIITLEKISIEFPGQIVRDGGLTACLTYMDFFTTSTQRNAVTTAANCCRNINTDSYPIIRDVMLILLNVLSNGDQKVLEQGCLCVSRIVESFRHLPEKLEALVDEGLLKAILRLLAPGTTNLISANVHTGFLRTLTIVARSSPKRSIELLKLHVVDTLYQILTGVSPPSSEEDALKRDQRITVMQALIHRPREQVMEALNLVGAILPFTPSAPSSSERDNRLKSTSASAPPDSKLQRLQMLREASEETKQFAMIMLPTLVDAYSSTVNFAVRERVLAANIQLLAIVDANVLTNSLSGVSYPSFLAAILSQQDHPALVFYALQTADLLLQRCEAIYGYQFYREGVFAEIEKLARRHIEVQPIGDGKTSENRVDQATVQDKSEKEDGTTDAKEQQPSLLNEELPIDNTKETVVEDSGDDGVEINEDEDEADDDDGDDDDDDDEDNDAHLEMDEEDLSDSDDHESSDGLSTANATSTQQPQRIARCSLDAKNAERASQLWEKYQNRELELRGEAQSNLAQLQNLIGRIQESSKEEDVARTAPLFAQLAEYFSTETKLNVTSFELLKSDMVSVLAKALSRDAPKMRQAFLEGFDMASSERTPRADPSTAFSALLYQLQDLLSRVEHFEVITVHNNATDGNRSGAAAMLAKQLKLKLVAAREDGIPKSFQKFMVSIHAIASFKALEEFLRQRITMAERPRALGSRTRESLLRAMQEAGAISRTQHQRLSGAFADVSPGAESPSRTISTARKPSSTTPSRGSPLINKRLASASSIVAPPSPSPSNRADRLECADETQIYDQEQLPNQEQDLDEESLLDALVSGLEDSMDESEDFPILGNDSTDAQPRRKSSAAQSLPDSPATGTRTSSIAPKPPPPPPMSYAAAVQATPQDWHLEFSVNGQKVSSDTTVYRAVHFNQRNPNDVSIRNLWSNIHEINFEKVAGPPSIENTVRSGHWQAEPLTSASPTLPGSICEDETTASILELLKVLYELEGGVIGIQPSYPSTAASSLEFVNTKLTAKLNRQLEEPLIVASNCLPSWSEDLARLYPFLFPFETRYLFLQSTSFGYSRSMTRWQKPASSNQSSRHRDERPYLGKPQRQKVRISRHDILKAGIKVMELYGASPAILEVEYFEEVGTGLGPTLEFYAEVSREFSKKKVKMWRENDAALSSPYAAGPQGLFPAPMTMAFAETETGQRILNLFFALGKFVARSMIDSRIIDISFNPYFFRHELTAEVSDDALVSLIRQVDRSLASSLAHLYKYVVAQRDGNQDSLKALVKKHGTVEDLALDFTLPGYPEIELTETGNNIAVTLENVEDYIKQIIALTIGEGIDLQINAFRQGFSEVFPYEALHAFTSAELVMLFGSAEEDWTLETLMDSVKVDHGYTLDSKSVKDLLQTMSEFTTAERRDFLQFVTGSPKLPIGGFGALTPLFTVVCKPSEAPYTSDDYLPSVMTCVNYLKLPNYTSAAVLRNKLSIAIKEGQGAFHLS